MNVRGVWAAVAGLVLPLLLLVGPHSEAVNGEEHVSELNPDDVSYAQRYAVTPQEAARRSKLMEEISSVNAALERAPEFGGLWLTHDPHFELNVNWPTDSLPDWARSLFSKELWSIVVLHRSHRSQFEIESLTQEFADAVANLRIDAFGVVSQGAVILRVPEELGSTQEITIRWRGKDVSLEEAASSVGARIERSPVSTPAANSYAGLTTTTCTSGFSVQSTTGALNTGVLTAGHCRPGPESGDQYYGSQLLPFQREKYEGKRDVQFHTTPNYDDKNWAYDGQNDATTPFYRNISGRKLVSEMFEGQDVCHYGKITNFGCGLIYSKIYSPSYVPNSQAGFIYVDSNSSLDLCEPGDSGGPWYRNENAFGIMSGQFGVDAIFMPIEYINTLDVTLLTS